MTQKFKCLECGKKTKQSALAIEGIEEDYDKVYALWVAHCPHCSSIGVMPFVSKSDKLKAKIKADDDFLKSIADALDTWDDFTFNTYVGKVEGIIQNIVSYRA